MTGHYYAKAISPSYVLFGSRWGECLIVDRATRRSFYDHGDTSGETADRLAELDPQWFDFECSELVECGGSSEPLPPGVLAWFQVAA